MAASDGVKYLNSGGSSRKRFKFITFAERVKRVDVDVFKYSDREVFETRAVPSTGDRGSFLHDELISLSQINVSKPFRVFCLNVEPLCKTLAQVLHHRARIVKHMLEILQDEECKLAWPPVLRLVAVIVRDIRDSFMEFLEPFITVLAGHVDPRDPEIAGEAFRSLSFVFKFLGRDLVERAHDLWPSFRSLFASNKGYVRSFAAQSLGYLLRKMGVEKSLSLLRLWIAGESKPESWRDSVAGSVASAGAEGQGRIQRLDGVDSPTFRRQVRISLSLLLFELVRSVRHSMTSKAPHIIQGLLGWMRRECGGAGADRTAAAATASDASSREFSAGAGPTSDSSPHVLVHASLCSQVVWHGIDHMRSYVRGKALIQLFQIVCLHAKEEFRALESVGRSSRRITPAMLHASRVLGCIQMLAAERGKGSGSEYKGVLALVAQTAVDAAKGVRCSQSSFLRAAWLGLVGQVAPALAGVAGSSETRDAARRVQAARKTADELNPYLAPESDESEGSDSDEAPELASAPQEQMESDSELSEDDEETLAIQAISHRMQGSGEELKHHDLFGGSSKTDSSSGVLASAPSAKELSSEAKRLLKRLKHGSLLAKLLKYIAKMAESRASDADGGAAAAPSPTQTWSMGLSVLDSLRPQGLVPVSATEALQALKEDQEPHSMCEASVRSVLGINGLLQSSSIDVARVCKLIADMTEAGVRSRAHSARRRLYLFALFSVVEQMVDILRSAGHYWVSQLLVCMQIDVHAAFGGFQRPKPGQESIADDQTSASAVGRLFIPSCALASERGCIRVGLGVRDLPTGFDSHTVLSWRAVWQAWQVAQLIASSERLQRDEGLQATMIAAAASEAKQLKAMLHSTPPSPDSFVGAGSWAASQPNQLPLLLFCLASRYHALAYVLQNSVGVGATRRSAVGESSKLLGVIGAVRDSLAAVFSVAKSFGFASRCNFSRVLPADSPECQVMLALESSFYALLHAASRFAMSAAKLRVVLEDAMSDATIEQKYSDPSQTGLHRELQAVLGVSALETATYYHCDALSLLVGCPERAVRFCALQLLASFEYPVIEIAAQGMEDGDGGSDSDGSLDEVNRCQAAELCVEIERQAPSIVSERTMSNHIRHLERLLLAESIPGAMYTIVLEYVVSGLSFIRYAPVNEVAAKVLANVGRKFQLSVWPAVGRLLELLHACRSTSGRHDTSLPPGFEEGVPAESKPMASHSIASLLRFGSLPFVAADPEMFGITRSSGAAAALAVKSSSTADKVRGVAMVAGVEAAQVAAIGVHDHRLAQDVLLQVAGALKDCAPLVKKHAESCIALLFSHCSVHYYDSRTRVDPDARLLQVVPIAESLQSAAETSAERSTSRHDAAAIALQAFSSMLSKDWKTAITRHKPIDKRHATSRLVAYLYIASRIGERMPKALAATVEALCTRLLVKGESGVAEASLEVLAQMKLPHILRCHELLESLLDPKKFRRIMASADLSPGGLSLPPDARRRAIPAISRVAVGHLLQYKRGGSARDRPEARRATVLQFFAKLEPAELLPAIQVLFRRYFSPGLVEYHFPKQAGDLDEWVAGKEAELSSPFELVMGHVCLDGIADAYLSGSLDVVRDLLRILGVSVSQYLPLLFSFVLSGLGDAGAAAKRQAAGQIAQRAYTCIAELFKQFRWQNLEYYVPFLGSSMASSIQALPWSCLSSDKSPAVLGVLAAIANGPRQRTHLARIDGSIGAVIDSVSAGLPGSKHIHRHSDHSGGVKPAVIGDVLGIVHDLLEPEARTIAMLVGDKKSDVQVDMASFLGSDHKSAVAMDGGDESSGELGSTTDFVLLPYYSLLLEALRCRWAARQGATINEAAASSISMVGWTGVFPNAASIRSMRRAASGGLASHLTREFRIVSMVASCCVALQQDSAATSGSASSSEVSIESLRRLAFHSSMGAAKGGHEGAADELFELLLPYVDLRAHTTPTRYRQRSLVPRDQDDPIGPDDRRLESFELLQKLASIAGSETAAKGLRPMILTLAAGPNESRENSRGAALRLMGAIMSRCIPQARMKVLGPVFRPSPAATRSSSIAAAHHLGDGMESEQSPNELEHLETAVQILTRPSSKAPAEAVDLAAVSAVASYYLADENFALRSRAAALLSQLCEAMGRTDAAAIRRGCDRVQPPFPVESGKGVLHGASVMSFCVLPAVRHVLNVAPASSLKEAAYAAVTAISSYFAAASSLRTTVVLLDSELPPGFELLQGNPPDSGMQGVTVRLGDLLYDAVLDLTDDEEDSLGAAQSAAEAESAVETGPGNQHLLVECCSINGMASSASMEYLAILLEKLRNGKYEQLRVARVVRHFVVPVAVQLLQRGGSAGAPRGAAKTRKYALCSLFFAIGQSLPWEQYGWLLKLLLRNLVATGSSALESAICALLDAFHFNADSSSQTGAKSEVAAADASVPMIDSAATSVASEEAYAGTPFEIDAKDRIALAVQGGAVAPNSTVVLRTLEEDVLPTLYKLLSNRDGMVKVEVAVACAKLVKLLPKAVLSKWLWGLLTKVALAMKSRVQQARNSARSAMVRIATTVGTQYLPSVISSLRHTLRDGYMVHVLGHVVYDVLAALKSDLRYKASPSASVSEMTDDSDSDGGSDSDSDSTDAADEIDHEDSALLAALPDLLEVVVEDVLGKVAMAKDPECGYVPKYPMMESRSCRGYLTFEIIASCVPFFPHPAVFQLTAPLLASLADGGAQDTKTMAAVVKLFSSLISGLTANPSVSSSGLNQFCLGLLRDNLAVDGLAARDGVDHSGDIASVRFGDLYSAASRQGYSATLRWRLYRMNSQPLWSASDPYMLIREIQSRAAQGAASGAGAANPSDSLAAVPLGGASQSRNTVVADVASILRPSSRPTDTFKIAAEPRMTGIGRYIKAKEKKTAADRARQPIRGGRASSLDGQSAEVLVWFSMALMMSGARKGKSSWKPDTSADAIQAVGKYVVRALLVLRSDRALAAGLRLVTMMLQKAPQLLQSIGKYVQQALLLHMSRVVRPVTGSSGVDASTGARGQVSQQTVKAVTAMLRYLPSAKISQDELKAIVLVLDADLEVPERQNSTFALLRAVLHRRLVAPEVYDLMDRVAKFMIRSTKVGARAQSAHVFLTFLMHFPLSEERLADHLRFFLRNLEYDKPGGRLAALDVIAAAVDYLPVVVLEKHAELLFLPLAARIVNDPEESCRAAAGLAVSRLVARVPHRRAQAIGKMVAAWCKQKQASPNRRLGFQLAGILIDTRMPVYEKSAADKVEKSMLTEVHRAIKASLYMYDGLKGRSGAVVPSSDEFSASVSASNRLSALVSSYSGRQANVDAPDEEPRFSTSSTSASQSGSASHQSERARMKALLMEAMDDDGFIRARPGVEVPADIDVDLIEEVEAIKVAQREMDSEGPASGAGASEGEVGVGSSQPAAAWSAKVEQAAKSESVSAGLETIDWQPLYYACVAMEKLARASPVRFAALLPRLSCPGTTTGSKQSSAKASAASGAAAAEDTDSDSYVIPAIRALSELLRYPHVWVRQVSTRLSASLLVAAGVPETLASLKDSGKPVPAGGYAYGALLSSLMEGEGAETLVQALLSQLYWLGTTRQHADAVLYVVLALVVLQFEQAHASIRASSSKAAAAATEGKLRVPIDGLVSESACRRVVKLLSKASLPVRSCLLDFFVGLASATGAHFRSFAPIAAEAFAKTMGIGGEAPGAPPTASMLEARGIGGAQLDEANAMGQEEVQCGGRDSLVASLKVQASEALKQAEGVLPAGEMGRLVEAAAKRRSDARAEKRSRKSLQGMLDPVAAAHGKRSKQEAGRRKKKRNVDERRDREGRSRKKARS